jgi:hypothetical protein
VCVCVCVWFYACSCERARVCDAVLFCSSMQGLLHLVTSNTLSLIFSLMFSHKCIKSLEGGFWVLLPFREDRFEKQLKFGADTQLRHQLLKAVHVGHFDDVAAKALTPDFTVKLLKGVTPGFNLGEVSCSPGIDARC